MIINISLLVLKLSQRVVGPSFLLKDSV